MPFYVNKTLTLHEFVEKYKSLEYSGLARAAWPHYYEIYADGEDSETNIRYRHTSADDSTTEAYVGFLDKMLQAQREKLDRREGESSAIKDFILMSVLRKDS